MVKKLLSLFLVLLFGLALVGCKDETPEVRELNLSISGLQQASERVFFTTFVRLFEAKYDATVNITYTTQADLKTKIETEITANNVVSDVVMVDTANMRPYIDGNWMEDITTVVDDLENRTITDMFDASTSKDGKT